MKREVVRGALVAAFLLAAPAAAQEPPPPDTPTENSVPRGASGAVFKEEKDPAPPPSLGITMPAVTHYEPPVYPEEAKQAGIEGSVILALDIDKDGHVKKAVVLEPGGHGFDQAALEAAKKLEFSPARKKDGTPFAARIRYRYGFTLTPAPKPPPPAGSEAAEAQKAATLSGVVLAAAGDAAIAGATVAVSGGKEATTDEHGAFSLGDLGAGRYTIKVTAPGYDPLVVEEELEAGEATEVKYRLLPKRQGGLEVTVTGERPPREVTKRTLTEDEIEKIPGTNGDALKSLLNLPGVARPPGILGLLIVRGSAPQDTQVFIDGTPVPIVYHFGGLTSVVPTEILDKIDFYPGNFGSEFGRAQGGIVDVGLRSPKEGFHGLAEADLVDVRLLLEGTIPGTDGWTFLAAGRRSDLEWLGPVLSNLGAGVTELPAYYDYQFMVGKKLSSSSSFRVTFFGSNDDFAILDDNPSPGAPAISGSAGLHTAFQRLQTRYTKDFSDGDRFTATVAFGHDDIAFGIGALSGSFDQRTVTGRLEYSTKISRILRLDAGLDMIGGISAVDFQLPPPPIPGQPPSQPFGTNLVDTKQSGGFIQPAAYVEAEATPTSRLRLVSGVRVDYFNLDRQLDVSPRISARYDILPDFPKTTLKGGVGFYMQPPQPYEVIPPIGSPDLESQRSIQTSLGVEQQITKQIDASVEGFYKDLYDQVVQTPSATGSTVTDTNLGTGYVVGAEVLLKYKPDSRFFGWLAYTLSRSTRRDGPGQPLQLFQYDQPHILTVLGSYKIGRGWEIGARFRLVSGNLVTPNVCNPASPSCNPNRVNALFNAASGTYTPIPVAGPYSERLPLFQQLDIRVDKTWRFKTWKLTSYLDVQNVYNYGNVEAISYSYNYTSRQYVAGLPILPSLGLRADF